MFNGLMRRSIFAKAYTIMRKNEYCGDSRYSCNADRRTHVIREDQERPAVSNNTTKQIHSIQSRAHPMLAHAEANITPGLVVFLEITRFLELGIIRRS